MKKIIIIGTLLVIVILFFQLTFFKNKKQDYLKDTYSEVPLNEADSTQNINTSEITRKSFLFEDFSDKDLSDWNISYQNAKGWIFDFKDSTGIIIMDIVNESFSKDSYGPWSNIILEKEIPQKDSMVFTSKISWDSYGSETSMQHIYFSFKDTNNEEVLFFGYNDPYISYKGGLLAKFHNKPYNWFKKRELNLKDDGFLKMVKEGNNVSLYYNDVFVMRSSIENNIQNISIIFGFFPSINYKNSNLKSTFGSLCIDFINISG